jgi:hypothetical protein
VTRSLFPDAATVRRRQGPRRQGPRGRQPWRLPGGSSPSRLASHFESHFRTSRVRRSATLAAFHDGRRYLIRDKWSQWSACFFGCSRTSCGERASTRGISLIATGDDQNSERCLTTPTPRRRGFEFFDSASVQERACAASPPAIRGSWKRRPRSTLRRLEIPTACGVGRPLFFTASVVPRCDPRSRDTGGPPLRTHLGTHLGTSRGRRCGSPRGVACGPGCVQGN